MTIFPEQVAIQSKSGINIAVSVVCSVNVDNTQGKCENLYGNELSPAYAYT